MRSEIINSLESLNWRFSIWIPQNIIKMKKNDSINIIAAKIFKNYWTSFEQIFKTNLEEVRRLWEWEWRWVIFYHLYFFKWLNVKIAFKKSNEIEIREGDVSTILWLYHLLELHGLPLNIVRRRKTSKLFWLFGHEKHINVSLATKSNDESYQTDQSFCLY